MGHVGLQLPQLAEDPQLQLLPTFPAGIKDPRIPNYEPAPSMGEQLCLQQLLGLYLNLVFLDKQ